MIKNNKGFTLVELLATIAIIGILGTVATVGTIKYLEQSRQKSYKIMSQSVYEAAPNCVMQLKCNLGETKTIDELIELGFLKNIKSPCNSEKNCTGSVTIIDPVDESTSGYKKYKYSVDLTCPGVKVADKVLIWPDAKEEEQKRNNNTPY